MRAYVLSRTEMSGGRFCTCVARQVRGVWRQYRLMNQHGYSMQYDETSLTEKEIRAKWNFGARVDIRELIDGCPRPTHPEDLRINPQSLKLPGRRLVQKMREEVVEAFSYDSILDLYPDMVFTDRYIPEQPLPRSVGYVRHSKVIIDGHSRRASIIDQTGHVLSGVSIVGTELRARHRGRFVYENCTIRLSIASPWDGNENNWNPRRCYIQLSDVVT